MGYINKLAGMGSSNSPGKLIISAGAGGRYGNTNYYFDDSNQGYAPGPGNEARNGVPGVNPAASVVYTNGNDHGTNLGLHITNGLNVAGYLCYGIHSALGNSFPLPGDDHANVKWEGNSGWWIIETIESWNGEPCAGMSNFYEWFSNNAFGGTNYSNTPVGAVTHVQEPFLGWNYPSIYFGLWEAGKNFGICAWSSARAGSFQAVGDPFVTK